MTDTATARIAAAVAPVLRPGQRLRAVTDADGPALTALIGAAYDEYACGPLDPEVFDADLAAPATAAARVGRSWWVVVDDGNVAASVAHGSPRRATPLDDRAGGRAEQDDGRTVVELHRLYLAPAARGVGLASALVRAVADEARLLGASALEAWSDTRLVDAHVRYRALGFALVGVTRELHDPAGTTELLLRLPL